MQSEAILIRYQIYGDTQMAESTRTTDPVQVRFRHLGKVEVDHNVHRLNVDTTGEQICRNGNKKGQNLVRKSGRPTTTVCKVHSIQLLSFQQE